MQFESFRREQPQINLSALIDIVFILLIFVVLAANFDRVREMNVVLPTAENTERPTPDALVLTLAVDGPILLDGQEVSEAQLPAALREQSERFDILVLVSDGRVELERAVKIFDEASAAGFESVSIATRQESP